MSIRYLGTVILPKLAQFLSLPNLRTSYCLKFPRKTDGHVHGNKNRNGNGNGNLVQSHEI